MPTFSRIKSHQRLYGTSTCVTPDNDRGLRHITSHRWDIQSKRYLGFSFLATWQKTLFKAIYKRLFLVSRFDDARGLLNHPCYRRPFHGSHNVNGSLEQLQFRDRDRAAMNHIASNFHSPRPGCLLSTSGASLPYIWWEINTQGNVQ